MPSPPPPPLICHTSVHKLHLQLRVKGKKFHSHEQQAKILYIDRNVDNKQKKLSEIHVTIWQADNFMPVRSYTQPRPLNFSWLVKYHIKIYHKNCTLIFINNPDQTKWLFQFYRQVSVSTIVENSLNLKAEKHWKLTVQRTLENDLFVCFLFFSF